MLAIHKSPTCAGKPIFMGMAAVGTNIYWQMIENFIYTMVKFNHSDCALMICVSDPYCIQLCALSSFPCFDFQYAQYRDVHHTGVANSGDMKTSQMPSALEQIALLKLFHIPRALAAGVDVFMLDLDVGFLDDPMVLVNEWNEFPTTDVFVQDDITFIMNRSVFPLLLHYVYLMHTSRDISC